MSFYLRFTLFLILSTTFSVGEEDKPVKRRPRIRVYDQSADVVEIIKPVEKNPFEDSELDRKIQRDIQAPSSIQNPLNQVSFLPSLGSSSWNQEVQEDEEEEDWVTPMDFLLEKDQLEEDELLSSESENTTPEGELEITDWEDLQKSMIEEALSEDESELTEEERTELQDEDVEQKDPSRSRSNAMEISDVAPLENLQNSERDQVQLRDERLTTEEFVPILRIENQSDGEIALQERNEAYELSGSQQMLNGLKEKWARPSDVPLSRSTFGSERSILPSERIRGASISEPLRTSSSILGNPAIRVLPKPAAMVPESRVELKRPAPQAPASSNGFPKEDFRIRSQIGLPRGM